MCHPADVPGPWQATAEAEPVRLFLPLWRSQRGKATGAIRAVRARFSAAASPCGERMTAGEAASLLPAYAPVRADA